MCLFQLSGRHFYLNSYDPPIIFNMIIRRTMSNLGTLIEWIIRVNNVRVFTDLFLSVASLS